MLHKILYLGSILLRQTIAGGVGDVHNRSASLNNCFYYTCQILVVGTACILCVELHVLHITLGILHGTHGTLYYLLTIGVELILYVRVGGSDSSVYSATFGIF